MTKITEANEAEKIENGDKLRVEYESVHGGTQSFTGIVDTVNRHEGVGMVDIFIRSDVDVSNRRDCYVDDGTPDRKVEFLMDDVTVENRNGYRWTRLSARTNDATVEQL